MKKFVVGCWLLVVGVVMASGAFGESVDYWYLNKQTVDATRITTGGGLLGGGWYYAEGDMELELPLLCIGTTETPARIILKDGARLVLRGVDNYPGLYVGANSKLEIYGQRLGTGQLIAYGSANAPGIGGGAFSGSTTCGSITVYGGNVEAHGGVNAPGIGGAYVSGGAGALTGLTVVGGSVRAYGGANAPGVGGANGFEGLVMNVTVTLGSLEAFGAEGRYGIGPGVSGTQGFFYADNGNVNAVMTGLTGAESGSLVGQGLQVCASRYIRVIGAMNVTANTSEIGYGLWFLAQGEISHGTITVNGSAHLVLWDGCDLKVSGGYNDQPGLAVASGNALEIVGGATGSGKLTATGGKRGAGIGSGYDGAGGTIMVNGGTVTATGGDWGAGIGGGYKGAGGKVTINGGTLAATGGDGGAGIGGGYQGAGGTVTISGGTVTATGGNDGAGIGGGDEGAGGCVMVNGGIVMTTGGGFGAGIGGGRGGSGGSVTINGISPERSESPSGDGYQGCTVTAMGGNDGAGIGGGSGGSGGSVTINGISPERSESPSGDGYQGCTVTATGGGFGAGIGGGCYGSGGSVTINGGEVTATDGYYGAGIGGGWEGAGGTTVITGGIFGMNLLDQWIPAGYAVFENLDEQTRNPYGWTVLPVATVTLEGGLPPHLAVAWTSGDGKRASDVSSVPFDVPLEATGNSKVIFRSKTGYWFAGGSTEVVYELAGQQAITIPKASIPVPLPYRQVLSDDVETFGDKPCRVKAPNGAYVDTAIYPDQDTSVKMDVRVDGAREYWFGCWNVNYNDGAFALGNDGGGINAGYGNQGGTLGSAVANGRHTVELTNRWVKVDGGVVHEFNVETDGFKVNYPLFLFAQDHNGSAYVPNDQGVILCYGCQIFTKGANGDSVLVRNLVPARLKIGDKEVGFYDTVNGLFFASCGEKPFGLESVAIVNIGKTSHMTAHWTSGDGTVRNAISGTFFEVPYGTENVKVTFVPNGLYNLNGDAVIDLGKVTKDVALGVGGVPPAPESFLPFDQIDYLDWDENQKEMKTVTRSIQDCEIVNADTRTFENGKWYVAVEDIVSTAEITVNGTANLILMDGITLTVNGGIGVDEGATLNIYGQSAKTGKLIAYGANCCAGIGGRNLYSWLDYGNCGAVTINGGTVTATGGYKGAGIGGGDGGAGGSVTVNGISPERSESPSGDGYQGCTVTATGGDNGAGIGGGYEGAGGTVTVSGGTVTATGGKCGAGIGGGWNGAGGEVTINGISPERSESPSGDGYQGCTVTAQGGSYGGAGIGGGKGGSGGSVTVNGGEVTATGGDYGAGIGGGDGGAGGEVTIYGGTVTATGGKWGAGIGGSYGAGGEVTINGGTVTATGGYWGAGIGGGNDGAGGSVTINGGTVTATGGFNGAGIGGGGFADGGTVTINGGTVTATGSDGGAGIGGGCGGADGTVTLDVTKVEVAEGMYGNGHPYVKIAEKTPVGNILRVPGNRIIVRG